MRLRGEPGQRAAGSALMRELAAHHPYTARHSEQVARLVELLADDLGVDATQRARLRACALLHDIGKLAVPARLLDGDTRELTEPDRATLRAHSAHGQQRLQASPALAEYALAVRAVHERWDGRGYPDGLVGEQIPLISRIVAVCDAFDAMTSPERRYQAPMTARRALDCLREHSAGQFDPRVVSRFVAVMGPRVQPARAVAGAV